VTILNAAQKSVTLGAAALLFGAWCGAALASNEIQTPCPELAEHTDESLHAILDNGDITSRTVLTVDSSDSVTPAPVADATAKTATNKHEKVADADEDGIRDIEIATNLPGVSADEMPRLRRQMFRTDI